ncbi:hypothetical protein [Pantoea vagans]|uniref:hypothetical protein n=1 Tax=Pantoea vagans TaxID=470934 RepID=UPI00320873DB
MVNPMRRVSAVVHKHGKGTGNQLAVLTLQAINGNTLSAWQQQISQTPGYISSSVLMPDSVLSSPLPKESQDHRKMQPMLLIHCSDALCCDRLAADAAQAFAGDIQRYALNWQLTKQELIHG